MTEREHQKAKWHLSKVDPVLAGVIKRATIRLPKKRNNHFRSLVEAIISQQLSIKAADTIEARFIALFGVFPAPERVLKMPDAKLRSVGLSGSKVGFIKDLARHINTGQLHFRGIHKMTDEEVIEMLVAVKGIGRWTAEMFLMFSLARPDLFSYGDLGLRNAIKKLYSVRGELTEIKAEKIAAKWSPYRTIACRYLWASLEQK